MSAPVDVLAAWDAVLTFAARGVESDDPAREMVEAGYEARAAVAELIEAAGTYEEAVRLFGRTSPSAGRAYDFLCSALAGVQGGPK